MAQPPPPRRHLPSSAIASFIDRERIDKLLARWVPEAADRAFVLRCVLDEGPAHHRGANFVLLSLLGQLLDAAKASPESQGPSVPVPMRLPPHIDVGEDGFYPLSFPRKVLERLAPAGSAAQEAMIDCLTDGPPQHSLANAAMLCLISALLERSGGGAP
ncbi:MAG: hypothetical protein HYZ28_00040 [Myxococcales bacterium]|nr:hypothetical protein [Myxococcales bacterium]